VSADTLTIGSLFSGIGGLDLGLECALRDEGFDVSTIWQCERDAWCRGILARHWPDALRYDDVRTVGTDAPRIDILCGGFPCQDVSYAGKGAGLAGERSGLWFQFARIVRDLRPRVVVVENVAALASRGLDAVLGSLSEAGYDALWFDLRASDVGAPHRRERLFIVAWRRDVADADGSGRATHDDQPRRSSAQLTNARDSRAALASADVADCDGGRCERERLSQHADESGARGREPHGCRARGRRDGALVADARRVDGNGRAHGGSRRGADRDARRWDESAGDDQRGGRGPGLAQPRVGGDAHGLPRGVDLAAHRWPAGPGEAQHEDEAPRVTQDRRERRQRLKALGNAVVPQQAYVVGVVVAEVLRGTRSCGVTL